MRKGVLVMVFVLAVLAYGCTSKADASGGTGSATPFIGGSEGISAKFADNSPPAEVTDAQELTSQDGKSKEVQPTFPFDVVVYLDNIGEHKVGRDNLAVTLSGISPSDFLGKGSTTSFKNQKPLTELTEVKKDPDGNKIPGASGVEVRFSGLAYQKILQGNNVFPIQADVCYNYQTKVQADICTREDATKRIPDKCEVSGTRTVFNSGAPVAVSSVKESIGGKNKIILTFTVRQVGSGSVFKQEMVDITPTGSGQKQYAVSCPQGNYQNENWVNVQLKTGITGETLTCSGAIMDTIGSDTANGIYVGSLKLSNGEGTFTCIQSTPKEDATRKVEIKLGYNYLITKNTQITVKHLLSE